MLADLVKAYLNERGINQKYLADQTGIPAQKLESFFNGRGRLYAEDYFTICEVLDVNPDFFYGKWLERKYDMAKTTRMVWLHKDYAEEYERSMNLCDENGAFVNV